MRRTFIVLLVATGIVGVFCGGVWLSYRVLPCFLGSSYEPAKLFDGFAGGLLASIVTFALFAVAYLQLGGLAKTASADFIINLKRDFFTSETRVLFQLVDSSWLVFRSSDDDTSYFSVETEKVDNSGLPEELKLVLKAKPFYSEEEVNDLLIGHFEDLGLLVEKGVLTFEMVYEVFSYYIEGTLENTELRKYIDSAREEDRSLYTNFLKLDSRCRARTKKQK